MFLLFKIVKERKKRKIRIASIYNSKANFHHHHHRIITIPFRNWNWNGRKLKKNLFLLFGIINMHRNISFFGPSFYA